jgi:hypothetical protein
MLHPAQQLPQQNDERQQQHDAAGGTNQLSAGTGEPRAYHALLPQLDVIARAQTNRTRKIFHLVRVFS